MAKKSTAEVPTPQPAAPAATNIVDRRIDMCVLFDVAGGSPQGDPAQMNNRPREDMDTGKLLFTDSGFKRPIRDYILMYKEGVAGYDIHVRRSSVLEADLLDAQTSLSLVGKDATTEEGQKRVREFVCSKFFDVRAFGAVLAHSKKANAGKVTGPVQFTPFWSVDPADIMEIKGTRVATANKERSDSMDGFNQDFSIKYMVPYALFRGSCFISPFWAKKTGFTWDDFAVLVHTMKNMFNSHHTSTSGLRTTRRLIAFEHDTHLGCAPAADLFDLVKVSLKNEDSPVRAFDDYTITVDNSRLPAGVTIKEY